MQPHKLPHISIWLSILLCCLLLGACGHEPERLSPLGWPKVSPEVDSLTLSIERLMINDENADSVEVFNGRLKQLASASRPELHLQERAMLFETGILSIRLQKKGSARHHIASGNGSGLHRRPLPVQQGEDAPLDSGQHR